jgi:formate-dependent nitrite reductase membrane component NrfD
MMVPDVEFASYYGRQVVKPAPWKAEIPTYLYTGGLAAGSGLIAAGAQLAGLRKLQRNARLTALAALGVSTGALITDLGKPSRFLNMLRTVKLTSPMSIGSWILAGFGGFTGAAAVAEIAGPLLPKGSSLAKVAAFTELGANVGSGAFSAPLAAYTAVLLSDTATPTWHASYRQLPFVFAGSALAAAGGAAMITTSTSEAKPARRAAVVGTVLELVANEVLERSIGIEGEPLRQGRPGRMLEASRWLMIGGAAATLVGGRWRPAAVVAGVAMNVGSALTRFGVFEAGIASAKDPKYTIVPQRQRLDERGPTRLT